MEENTKEIIIDLSSEYRVKIEDVQYFDNSIFSKIYRSARDNVDSILNQTKDSKSSYDSYNNIIAFTGERGKGKSSAMISFLEALKSVGDKIKKGSFLSPFYNEQDELAKYSFINLDVIDPSLFRGNETLFEIVLAKMFSKFKMEIDNNLHYNLVTDENRRLLVKLFQNVFENLKYTNGNYKDELYKQEALDALIKLSSSSNLRDSFKNLVKTYLEVMNKNEKTESVLVIPIDDFDLKIEGVYEMLEDVRQFLITEKVIVLIACKMEQMQQAVEMTIQKHFNFTPNFEYGNYNDYQINKTLNISEGEIKNKATKFLEKLFPINRQNVLPNIDNINLDEIISNTISSGNDLKILETIFEKKRVFYSSDAYLNHLIYDNTLRSLINLLASVQSTDFSQFVKYCEARLSEYLKPEHLTLIMNCEYALLNTYILKIVEDEFLNHIHNYRHVQSYHYEELRKLNNSTNYEIIQNADVSTFLYLISKSLNVAHTDFKKIKAIGLVFNLRNLIVADSEKEIFKNKSLSGILTARFLDNKYRIPQNSSNRKYRDYFKVNAQFKNDNYSVEELIVITSFIQNLGETDSDYMSIDENTFLNSIKRRGAPYQYYYFSIFTFLNAPRNISKLYSRFGDQLEGLTKIEVKWNDSYYGGLFSSYDFVIEFYENLIDAYRTLSKSSAIKSSQSSSEKDEDLHEILILLFTNGLKQVFKKLNEKYRYLNLHFDDYLEQNKVLSLFIEYQSNKKIKDFVNSSFLNYEYVKSLSTVDSLNDIHFINNIEPVEDLLEFLKKEDGRINRKTLQDFINAIDDKDSELREFLLQKNYFDNLFSTNSSKKNKSRETLIRKLIKFIEDGQS